MDQMRLSIRTKPLQIQQNVPATNLAIHNKEMINNQIISPNRPEAAKVVPKQAVYNQRKGMLKEFGELFSALMKLPDKQIQAKVLGCINASYCSVGTQTEPVEILERSPTDSRVENVTHKQDLKQEPLSLPSPSDTSSELSKPPTPKKRKRKRKVSQPQANKVSRVAETQKRHMAKMSRPQNYLRATDHAGKEIGTTGTYNEGRRTRTDSNISDASYINNFVDDWGRDKNDKETLFQSIIKDHLMKKIPLENGLLPIHESIVKHQITNLRIQIFIWKDCEGADLNELLTEDDEDLLQLAIAHRCSIDIISLLLIKGLNPNCLDTLGNTAIHLAVLNDLDEFSLSKLMTHIDLKILLTLNDDGYTSLQLAIRQDCYLLAECILNAMDKRLSGDVFYKRDIDPLETTEKIKRSKFKSYYENVCMEVDDYNRGVIKNHDLKQKLLQAPDMRSGNTALFFAIENESEHLIYFLLAHLTDPRTENLAGQDCKTFFNEFGKTLKLSLNIDTAMEKVIKILS
uniref:Uncharacterized protein n=1 Tax=Stomoxys calcitrans TaxID=35570 RepID=A0A1I8PR77_STOCA